MYISEIEIKNFRNFSSFRSSLNDGLSIILGENNIGKSNFIEALNLIFNINYSFKKRILDQDDFWNGIIIQDSWPEVSIKITLQGITTENELAVTSRWLTKQPGEAKLTYKFRPKANISSDLPNQATPINKIHLPLHEYEWIIFGGEIETLDNFDFNMLSKFNVEYVGALRNATEELKKPTGQLHSIFKQFDLDASELKEISKKIDELNEQIIKGKDIQSVQGEINYFLDRITGTTRQQVKIQMSDSDYVSLLKDLRVLITSKRDTTHTVERNGLGYNNLLFISLLLTQFTTLKKKKLEKYDYIFPILIVEEPEAHLHSQLQKYLANYFFGQKILGQVIMTTHSSQVSSHSELDSLIIFYKSHDEIKSKCLGSIFDHKNKVELEYKLYLERWLDATKSDIFFGRKVLLVEGIAERLLVPEFFSMLYKSKTKREGVDLEIENTLEGEGITILSVDGVAFRPFLKLYGNNGLNMKCAVLTDSDPDAIPIKDINGKLIHGSDGKTIKEEVYPSSIEDSLICARTNSLITDFGKSSNIFISNNVKTFEYDLILSGNVEFFRDIINKYNIGTKINRHELKTLEGHEFAKEAYKVISKEKGQFAQYTLNELKLHQKSGKVFNIPQYIKNAFEFLLEEGEIHGGD